MSRLITCGRASESQHPSRRRPTLSVLDHVRALPTHPPRAAEPGPSEPPHFGLSLDTSASTPDMQHPSLPEPQNKSRPSTFRQAFAQLQTPASSSFSTYPPGAAAPSPLGTPRQAPANRRTRPWRIAVLEHLGCAPAPAPERCNRPAHPRRKTPARRRCRALLSTRCSTRPNPSRPAYPWPTRCARRCPPRRPRIARGTGRAPTPTACDMHYLRPRPSLPGDRPACLKDCTQQKGEPGRPSP